MTIATAASAADISSDISGSGVSWSAVFAGAVAAASFALILLALGAGLGFSSVSPWSGAGLSGVTVGVATLVWLFLVQIISSGLGGYLAGRLRTHWHELHGEEVFFRDTAHGLLAWGVAAIVGASVLTGAAANLVGNVSSTAVEAATGAVVATGTAAAGSSAYIADTLLRSEAAKTPDAAAAGAEIGRIVTMSVANGAVSDEDKAYLSRLVARSASIPEPEAQMRVDQVMQRAMNTADEAKRKALETADAARKAAAGLSLWVVASLLSGAFAASLLATYGGRLRDRFAHLG